MLFSNTSFNKVGNPTRLIAVKSFLEGYECDFWSRNERKDE